MLYFENETKHSEILIKYGGEGMISQTSQLVDDWLPSNQMAVEF